MIKSLKKTMSPVLSDISIEWLFPETKEVLLSPVGNTFLFPGDSLIGYCVVCDTTRYHANPKSVSARHLLKGDNDRMHNFLCCEYFRMTCPLSLKGFPREIKKGLRLTMKKYLDMSPTHNLNRIRGGDTA